MAVHCLKSGRIRLYVPSDLKISLRRDVPRDISRASGNPEVGGNVQPNTSLLSAVYIYILPRLELVYGHSLIINPFLRMYQEIHPCRAMSIVSAWLWLPQSYDRSATKLLCAMYASKNLLHNNIIVQKVTKYLPDNAPKCCAARTGAEVDSCRILGGSLGPETRVAKSQYTVLDYATRGQGWGSNTATPWIPPKTWRIPAATGCLQPRYAMAEFASLWIPPLPPRHPYPTPNPPQNGARPPCYLTPYCTMPSGGKTLVWAGPRREWPR